MRRWRYLEPLENGETTTVDMTEDEILQVYWPWWYGEMIRIGKEAEATREACLEDWIVVNWAEEVKDAKPT